MTARETWREIPDWEGYYEVSDLGRVRSMDRTIPSARWGSQFRKGKVMALTQKKTGYWHIGLRRDHVRQWFGVHHLVCLAFHGSPPTDRHQAAHYPDPNKSNNCATNLMWATPLENQRHRLAHGTHNRGVRNYSAKLGEQQVREIRLRTTLESVRETAETYGVTPGQIRHIVSGRSWGHLKDETTAARKVIR